jgi:hypothetical protein
MERSDRLHLTIGHVSGRTRLRVRHAVVLAAVVLPRTSLAQDAGTKRTFFDYILPTPIACPLSTKTWGCTAAQVAAKQNSCGNESSPQVSGPVIPRDTCNGLESAKDPPENYYWDGRIIRAKDGVYHMIADRWPDANAGFQCPWSGPNYCGDAGTSAAVHATSKSPLGPYTETGYCYSFWSSGDPHRGHNTTVIELLDGTYALTTGEGGISPFTVWTSKSLDGPWTACPNMKADGSHEIIDTTGVTLGWSPQPLDSNVSIVARPDGKFQILQRKGMIGIASNVCGPYKLQKPTNTYPADQQPPSDIPSIYPDRKKHTSPTVGKQGGAPETPQATWPWAEDPVIWYSGGKYHALYDYPIDRVGYHLTSVDGIHDWTDEGFAYDPRMADKLFAYTDGTANGWFKMERPSVLMENGHVTHLTFAVSDVDKDSQIPANSSHGSKIVVIPFDGVRFDCETGNAPCDERRDAGSDTGSTGGTGGGTGGVGGSAGTSAGGSGGGGRGGTGGSSGAGAGGKANSGGAGRASLGGSGAAGTGGVRGGTSGGTSGPGGSTAKPGGATASSGCGCDLGQLQRGAPLWTCVLGLSLLIWRRRR